MKELNNKNDLPYEEINLWDYVQVIVRRRRMIIRNVLIAMLAIGVISLFLPKKYTAVTTLLPPEKNQAGGLWSALSASSPLANLGITSSSSMSDVFVEILKSRTVRDAVLHKSYSLSSKRSQDKKKITLLEYFGEDSNEKARKILSKLTTVSASSEGIITIKVELGDPQLAAQVANAYVEELDRVNREKNISRAKSSRIYIENQLKQTEKKLKQASEALAQFQKKYKAISLEEQTKTAIEKAGEIKGKILAKEVELGIALQTMKPNNAVVVRLRKELEELKKQYSQLQYGDDIPVTEQKEFYIPFAEVPEVGLELAKLTREVKVQETVWELLNQQYYQAKIQEARDTPTVQVLDEAIPPEMRSKPKRKLLVLVGGFVTLLFSIFWAFTLEYFDKLSADRESYSKVQTMYQDIKKDVEALNRFAQQQTKILIKKIKSRAVFGKK
ncbi:hypothetical protein DRQ12_06170 [candidate division KSB1 bacterium]|nr:MAG: hypothetical protein DRQ12_06170 [candidate division KSB1 bacterium]